MTGEYVLVTPARDEAATIGRVIDAVVTQTVLPREWVIVDDGSTDGTTEALRVAAEAHHWIHVLSLPARSTRSFAAVVENVERGVAALKSSGYKYLGLLDADVAFRPDYFEQLIGEFESDAKLGLAGGLVVDPGDSADDLPRNVMDVPGAVQFFRRECFEQLGALVPIAEGGWDCLTCVVARMRGFETRLVASLIVDHLKPRNAAQGGMLRRRWQLGVRDYAIGYNPMFTFFKAAAMFGRERPFAVAAALHWLGFCYGAIQRRPRVVPTPVIEYLRREQAQRLRELFHLTPTPDGSTRRWRTDRSSS